MDIPDIEIDGVRIDPIEIPVWDFSRNVANPNVGIAAPVTVDIGVPVIDMPGCVEAHQQNNPRNDELVSDDPKGTITFCDAGMPNFNPMDFKPNEMVITRPPAVDTRTNEPPKPEVPQPEIPKQAAPPATAKIECPTKAQKLKEPVGTLVEGYRKRVTEYRLVGNECVQITEAVALPQQIIAGLPSGGQVVQVGGIAVIATSSALLAKPLADLLLKAVKPAVKKVMKKIAKLRGKPEVRQSAGERRAEQRQMNHAVKALRSVFPRKKKRKGSSGGGPSR